MTSHNKHNSSPLIENIKSFTYAALLVVGIRTFFVQPFHIPSGSMIPTLEIGDNLFVSKFTYGLSRYSFPFGGNINYFEGRIWGSEPKLGDVAVFRPVTAPDTDFIKRVVGLPGDRVQMKEGILYINDVPSTLEQIEDFETVDDDGTILHSKQYLETLPNGVKHKILKKEPFGEGRYDNTPVFHVPVGHYFMVGDNRDGSNDSRAQTTVGFIPYDNLIGNAKFVFFATGDHTAIWEIWKWPFTAKYSRIFAGIY